MPLFPDGTKNLDKRPRTASKALLGLSKDGVGRVAKLRHYPLLFVRYHNSRVTGRTLHPPKDERLLAVGTGLLLLLLLLLGVSRASIPTGLLLVVFYRGHGTAAPAKVRVLHIVHVRHPCRRQQQFPSEAVQGQGGRRNESRMNGGLTILLVNIYTRNISHSLSKPEIGVIGKNGGGFGEGMGSGQLRCVGHLGMSRANGRTRCRLSVAPPRTQYPSLEQDHKMATHPASCQPHPQTSTTQNITADQPT